MISRLIVATFLSIGFSIGISTRLDAEDALHAAKTNQENVYTVRGTIRKLPGEARSSELLIRHEPIPSYVDETGKVVGMPAMTMPFQIKEGLSLEGLKEGDQIEFTWSSRWHPKPADKITSIKKLG